MAYVPLVLGQTPDESTASPVALPLTQDGTLQGIYQILTVIANRLPNVNALGLPRHSIDAFGGTVMASGTGAGGAGIPRVTVSNDSTLAANQSCNTNQFGGQAVNLGPGPVGTGTARMILPWEQALPLANVPVQQLLSLIAVTGGP